MDRDGACRTSTCRKSALWEILATVPCWSEGARLDAYNCDPCGLNIVGVADDRAMILQIGRFHRYSSAEAARELRWGAWRSSTMSRSILPAVSLDWANGENASPW
jgi:hypothetical protein